MRRKMSPYTQELLYLVQLHPGETSKFYQEKLDIKYNKRVIKVDSALHQLWMKGLIVRDRDERGIYRHTRPEQPVPAPVAPPPKQSKKKVIERAEFLLVSDTTSAILRSTNNLDELQQAAKFIRECGGACTIFEATNL